MPESCLTCTRGKTPSSPASAPKSSREASRQIVISAPAPSARPISSPATEPMTRIGTSASLTPECRRLGCGRDGEHRRASPESRPGALGHTVAVRVRLDHRAHLGAAFELAAQVRDVLLRSRPGRLRATARFTDGAPRAARRSRRSRSPTRPRRPARPRRPRRSCSPRRRRTPLRTAQGPGRRSAPIVPARTSPVPAVASAGAETTLTATGPPGAATIVSSPLSTTTQPPRSAASRAHARRCAPISSESLLEQAPQLAGVRRDHRGLRARGEALERAGVGVQAVGVDHERQLGAGSNVAGDRKRSVGLGRARARGQAPQPSRTPPGSRRRRPSAKAPSAEAQPRLITSVSFASKIGSSSPGTATVA